MIRTRRYRGLAAIALQRLSEQELRAFHEYVVGLSPMTFINLVRDVEDEVESSLAVVIDRSGEYDLPGFAEDQLYAELERIRRKELQIPVYRFAELLTEALAKDDTINANQIPAFDSRRGLQTWISRLVRTFSEHQVFRALSDLRSREGGKSDMGWRLR